MSSDGYEKTCEGCGARMWMVEINGHWYPLQRLEDVPDELRSRPTLYWIERDAVFERVDGPLMAHGAELWISHFQTCPEAKRFSRRGPRASPRRGR